MVVYAQLLAHDADILTPILFELSTSSIPESCTPCPVATNGHPNQRQVRSGMRGRSDSTFRDHIVIAHRLPARTWVTVHECQPGPRRKGDPQGPVKIFGA